MNGLLRFVVSFGLVALMIGCAPMGSRGSDGPDNDPALDPIDDPSGVTDEVSDLDKPKHPGFPEDGTEPDDNTQPPAEGVDPSPEDPVDVEPPDDGVVLPADLDPIALQKIQVLRGAIFDGLDRGREHYGDTISVVLQGHGIMGYDADTASEENVLDKEVESCPFAKYYDNGFEPSPMTCEYLVDIAKVESYAKLSNLLDDAPDLQDTLEYGEEAVFWREQGAISGIEEQRVTIQSRSHSNI